MSHLYKVIFKLKHWSCESLGYYMIWINASTKWSHVYSQLKVCEIIMSTIWLIFLTFQKAFDKYHSSIEIDIEHLVAYAYKNGLDDPFFRRLKLIVWLILIRPYLINSILVMRPCLINTILGINNLVCCNIDLHQANTSLYISSPLNLSLVLG